MKFVFSKKATIFDKIFTIDLTLTKGQLISKANCQAVNTSKNKQLKTPKRHFEII